MVNKQIKWDGKISNLRISDGAFPELFSELAEIKQRDRCDRLRLLATLGLCYLRDLGQNNRASIIDENELVVEKKQKEPSPEPALDKTKNTLKERLLGSLGSNS